MLLAQVTHPFAVLNVTVNSVVIFLRYFFTHSFGCVD